LKREQLEDIYQHTEVIYEETEGVHDDEVAFRFVTKQSPLDTNKSIDLSELEKLRNRIHLLESQVNEKDTLIEELKSQFGSQPSSKNNNSKVVNKPNIRPLRGSQRASSIIEDNNSQRSQSSNSLKNTVFKKSSNHLEATPYFKVSSNKNSIIKQSSTQKKETNVRKN
jgi:hypothetical protein